MQILLFSVLAFMSVLLLLPLVKRWAIRTGFVDQPGGRKHHENATPPVGGLILFPVFIGGAALLNPQMDGFWAFCAALVLLIAVGAWDDRFGLPAWTKFGAQFLAAFLIVIPGQAHIASLGDLFGLGEFWLGFMTVPFAVIATVLLINAVNLMDGLDGLAGGKGFIIIAWLLAACLVMGNEPYVGVLAVLLASLAGFLMYNLRHPLRARASVFLGDAGSLALGGSLAWLCINIARLDHHAVLEPISVAWLLALPIYDTCAQFARRMSEGRHPFDADHNHFHHHFVNAGVPVCRTTFVILFIVFITGAIGVGGVWMGVPLPVLTIVWIAGLFTHMYLSLRPARMQKIIRYFHGGSA